MAIYLKKLKLYKQLSNKNVIVLFTDENIGIIQLTNTAIMMINRSEYDYKLNSEWPPNFLKNSTLEDGHYTYFNSGFVGFHINGHDSNPTYDSDDYTLGSYTCNVFAFIKVNSIIVTEPIAIVQPISISED